MTLASSPGPVTAFGDYFTNRLNFEIVIVCRLYLSIDTFQCTNNYITRYWSLSLWRYYFTNHHIQGITTLLDWKLKELYLLSWWKLWLWQHQPQFLLLKPYKVLMVWQYVHIVACCYSLWFSKTGTYTSRILFTRCVEFEDKSSYVCHE